MKKKYIKPTAKFVELRVEEKLAVCGKATAGGRCTNKIYTQFS